MRREILPSQDYRTLSVMVIVALAVLFSGALLMALRFLETKWLVALLTGFGVVALAFLSGRLERIMLVLLFLVVPVNVDFHFEVGTPLDLFYLPAGVPRLGISAVDIFLIFLYASWFWRIVRSQATDSVAWPKGATLICCFIAWAAMSMFNAPNRLLSVFLLVGYVKAFLLFFFIANNVRTRDDLLFVAKCLMVGLLFEGLLALAQHLVGGNLGLGVLGERKIEKSVMLGASEVFRVGGTLGHANFLGGYLVSLLPLSLALCLSQLNKTMRFVMFGIFSIASLALILTYSRSAWMMGFIACVTLVGWSFFQSKKFVQKGPLITVIVIGGLVAMAFLPLIRERMFADDKGSTYSRVPQLRMATSMIKSHPFLGVGLNNQSVVANLHEPYVEVSDGGKRVYQINAIHNLFFVVAAETGMVGLFFLIGFLWTIARQGWRKIKSEKDSLARVILLAMAIGFFARLPHEAFHTSNLPTLLPFWIYAACLVAPRKRESK
jgi:putative inorganic carbon (hco3(-)) transporter